MNKLNVTLQGIKSLCKKGQKNKNTSGEQNFRGAERGAEAGCVHLRRWLASSLAMEGLLLLQAANKLRLSTLLSASEEERKH